MKIHHPHDFATGVALMLTGGGFGLGSLQYRLGSSIQPGPGYFPLLLSSLLGLLGGVILLRSMRAGQRAEKLEPVAWRALIVVMLSIFLFGFLLPKAGLFITFPLVVVTVSAASRDFSWRLALVCAAVLTLGAWLLFVVLLRLPLPVWPIGL